MISACTSAWVHPLPCNQSPRVFSAFISICNPPNITTSLSSPYVSGYLHWICFARVNNGSSQVSPLQSKIHFSCKMVAILSKWLSSIFGKQTSMCNCTILITSSTLITSSIHKKKNYGTYSMTLMVNSGHFEKWPPNLLRGES